MDKVFYTLPLIDSNELRNRKYHCTVQEMLTDLKEGKTVYSASPKRRKSLYEYLDLNKMKFQSEAVYILYQDG